MPVLRYRDHLPRLGSDVALEDEAYAIGDLTVNGPARFAAGAVVRADRAPIVVGPRCHIGHRSTVHVDSGHPTQIGADVWIGEDSVVHGCTIGDGVRVEDGGLVLRGSTVGAGSLVAADSLVPEGATFPANSYIAGTPGRRQRDTTPEEREETLRRTRSALRTADQAPP
jgi:carbonic anhydrase/acetyltransferase-like protein (isoleucine patch superfamily)